MRSPIVGLRHSDFLLDRFFVVSNSEKKSDQFFIGPKVGAHKLIFIPIFCRRQPGLFVLTFGPIKNRTFPSENLSAIKNRSVCAE